MWYRANAILSKGLKKLRENRIGIVDVNWPKGYSMPYDIMQKEFWREREFITPSSAFEQITCASPVIYIHVYIIVTVIILFLFSVLVNSFISTHKFYFVFSLLICSPILLRREGVSKWLCGDEPPAGLKLININSRISVTDERCSGNIWLNMRVSEILFWGSAKPS